MRFTAIATTIYALTMVGCATSPAADDSSPLGTDAAEAASKAAAASIATTAIRIGEQPLHFYQPAPPDERVWTMPALPHLEPAFPRLSGEPVETRSVGDVSDGWLSQAVPIERPQPNMAILHVQRERGLHYTTPELLDLIEAAAAHVQKSHPGSPLWLGNFSRQGGGDIPYSVSHNSGRDADVGFYLVDATNTPVSPRDLLPLDRKGRFEREGGDTWYFDVPRNWAFVEGLMRAGRDKIQYIFISNPLRRLLIRYARSQKVDNAIVAAAARRLIQPSGALPHNDHFHIRVYCDQGDLGAGCVEQGSGPRGYRSARADALADTRVKIRAALASDDESRRAAAVRRMAELGEWNGLDDALVDRSPMVRAAAVRFAPRAGVQSKVLAERLLADRDGRVFVEVVHALGEFGDDTAWNALAEALAEPRPVGLAARQFGDGRLFVAQTLGASERLDVVAPLVERVGDSAELDAAVLGALRHITNASAPQGAEPGEWWRAWWKASEKESRDALVARGFREAGYAVESLEAGSVWPIVRAVRDERPWVAWNAQRALQRMSTSDAPTLTWPTYDAWYYWRWWFKKKTKLAGVPPVPEDLDTEVHPYQSPEERSRGK